MGQRVAAGRSIPACAGEPCHRCGGARWTRSIPACAGEPIAGPDWANGTAVYPRVCGGTSPAARHPRPLEGLSPRVRGNPAGIPDTISTARSIPACAGEPCAGGPPLVGREVYPRVCGGTGPIRPKSGPPAGLSPRVRGNPQRATEGHFAVRSIPACAGEPSAILTPKMRLVVYPRVCGGTGPLQARVGGMDGLSPRVRGNPVPAAQFPIRRRSIPACAGEPAAARAGTGPPQVYPRVCGGTRFMQFAIVGKQGLSPRVRGNRPEFRVPAVPAGSIPACAGEPRRHLAGPRGPRVYPRVCGGTSM